MLMSDINRLLGLGVVVVVAVGVLLLLLRLSDRANTRQGELLPGYPPDRFPLQELTRSAPLRELAATQARLIAMYQQMPAQSDLAIWLYAFLKELREIMDTAYRVTAITHVYGRTSPLERLVAEVQQIESQLADHVVQRLLARDGDTRSELLEGRLEALRLCVRELATMAA